MLLAGEKEIIPCSVAAQLARLAPRRSMLVHRYWRIDDERLYRETVKSLDAVAHALEALRRYVEAHDPRGGEEEIH